MKFLFKLLGITLFLFSCNDREIDNIRKKYEESNTQNLKYQKKIENLKGVIITLKDENTLLRNKNSEYRETPQGILSDSLNLFDESQKEIENLQAIKLIEKGREKLRELKIRFPNSKESDQAEKLIKKADNELETRYLVKKFRNDIKTNSQKAEKTLSKLNSKIGQNNFDSFKRELENLKRKEEERKNRPIKLSFKDLHKKVNTGMEIGKIHEVNAYLDKSGNYLCKKSKVSDQCSSYSNFSISIKNDFSITKKASSFYDLRGKEGCFRVYLSSGAIWIKDFKGTNCEISNWIE